MSNPQDILMGGGLDSFEFNNIGDGFNAARIVRIGEPRQNTDPATGEPKFWDQAKTQKILSVMVEIELAQNERTDPNDHGARAIYVTQGSERQKAIAKAVRATGNRNFEEGGYLSMVFTGTEPSSIKGGLPKKLYQAAYAPPPSAGSNALMQAATDYPQVQPQQPAANTVQVQPGVAQIAGQQYPVQAQVQQPYPQAQPGTPYPQGGLPQMQPQQVVNNGPAQPVYAPQPDPQQVQQQLAAQNPLATPGPSPAYGTGQPGMTAPVTPPQPQGAAQGVDLSGLPADVQQLLAMRNQQQQ